MFAAVLGIVQVSFVVIVVNNLCSLDDNEKNAVDQVDRSRVAAKAISKSIKFFKHKKHYYKELEKQHPGLKSDFLSMIKTQKNEIIKDKIRSQSALG